MQMLFLLLPALIPSWRFFKTVEPSPRVQWTCIDEGARQWQEFYPRPDTVSPLRMLRRMVWNPHWNEALYLVSLAERQTIAPSEHSKREITRRVADLLLRLAYKPDTSFQFRILYVYRDCDGLRQTVTYESPITMLEAVSR